MPNHYGERKSRAAFKDTSPKRKYVAKTKNSDEDYGEGSKKWPKTPGKDWQLAKKGVNDVNA